MLKHPRFIFCACLMAFSCPIQADFAGLKVSGFASVGFSFEGEEELGAFRDNTQRKRPDSDFSLAPDSQAGVQFSYRISPKWQATTQFVLADKAKYDLDSATEWAFIGYSPAPDIDIRAGRMAVDIFKLSEVRRVDYTYLWVRPPLELYGWITPYSIDGVDVAKSFSAGSVYLRAKLQYGSARADIEPPDASRLLQTRFNDLFTASLTGDYRFWSARLSYAQFKIPEATEGQRGLFDAVAGIGNFPGPLGAEANQFATRLADSYGATARYYQAGLSYDDGAYVLDLELARMNSDSYVLPTGNAGYISLGYRVGALTPYVVYSAFEPDRDLVTSTADWSVLGPGGDGLKDFSVAFLNGARIDQHTTSAGVRWDFEQRLALKAQWDRTKVESQAYGLWAFDESPSVDSTVNVFSLSLNYIF
ncbi:hypothetical protein LPB19_11935 [Marinobacter salinisoli]|uniref:Porin domain-containing protein n=1 Tax=Marinobacter salinisoli TaxID=2769486 RepID=A0ABX7MUH3_9GAMM|nr:hypothetical protein [Marinobacter salinisoli]QSP93903.1 hypothetical protein LPB19_11935 [Marinobacter salinisoli]